MPAQNYSIPNRASGDRTSFYGEGNISLSSLAQVERLAHEKTIYPRFRIFLLNPDETVKYQLPPEDIELGGNANENYQVCGQRRTLSFTLCNEEGLYTPSANSDIWYGTKFALEVGLKIPDEDESSVVWFRKGIYVITGLSLTRTAEQKDVAIEAGDKYAIFENASGTIPASFEADVNTDIKGLLNDILTYQKGDGYILDPKPMIYHSSFEGKKTPLKISEGVGSTWGSIIQKISEFLQAEIFYNAEGNLTVIPRDEVIQDGDKPVLFNLVDEDGDFQNNNISLSMNDTINRVVVIGATINGAISMATAENNNALSPVNISKIGYRTKIVNDSNITSNILAQERADYELRKQTLLKTSISNSIYFNPLLTVNNLVTITDETYKMVRERVLLQSLSFSLDYSGLMSISSTNINNLPFTIN